MRILFSLGVMLVAGVLLPEMATAVTASDPFKAAMASRAQAEAAEAAMLSPGNYAAAVKTLERARREAASGKATATLSLDISTADNQFRAAVAAAQLAQRTFADVIREREAARSADAWRLVPERWLKAERNFSAATKRLEDGGLKSADELGVIAAGSYREAQLQALRNRYLSPTRALLVEAERMKAARYAPQTLAEANTKLAEAESVLAANRSQPEIAAPEIETARLAAAHALHIATVIRQVDKDEQTIEDLVLSLEQSVRRMAEAAGLPAIDVAGDAAGTELLVTGMKTLRTRAENAEKELGERDRRLSGMEEELREMDTRLGGATTERDRLLMKQAAEQRLREQLSAIRQQLPPNEAQIIQSPGKLILRLTGLSFASGSAKLNHSAGPLLQKVGQAIALFPRAGIIIEGHTDSSGDAQSNQRLSEARAQAVQTRLMTELALPAGRLHALGYGEDRPVASNDTSAGRKQNRRIDIVIQTASQDASS
jgi:outer membrane protein OmpA-like peptidoglycan-associated protein